MTDAGKVLIVGKSEQKLDLSAVKFSEWECFGHIEPNHSECKECPFKIECAVKSEKSKK